jgi:hypothetical protein
MIKKNISLKKYKIVDFNDSHQENLFSGKIPKDAAHQAFPYLLKFIDNINGNFLVFTIKNIDSQKEYTYIGTRITLENPIYKLVNGIEVKFIYKDILNKYNKELE